MGIIHRGIRKLTAKAPRATRVATTRKAVAALLRARTGGVNPKTAHERTKAFYRASGNDWTLALA